MTYRNTLLNTEPIRSERPFSASFRKGVFYL